MMFRGTARNIIIILLIIIIFINCNWVVTRWQCVDFLDKNICGKLVGLLVLLKKKYITIHGHMNVKISKVGTKCNSLTQQFIGISTTIDTWATCFGSIESSSGPQRLQIQFLQGSQLHCGIPNAYILCICHLQALKDYRSNFYKVVNCTVVSPMLTYHLSIGDPTVHLTAL